MKKYIKDISIFVMGIITATSIGVAAYTISAKEIGYSPKDSSWKVNNVADAIESLKTLKGGSTNYSTEEQVVGTWIDEKPLYQKTYVYSSTIPSNTWVAIGTLSSDIVNNVHYIEGTIHNDNIAHKFMFGGRSGDSNTMALVNEEQSKLYIYAARESDTWSNAVVTIRYTKTTDSANNS